MICAYFAFHKPTWRKWYGIFGHVQMFGPTVDGSWVFFDPSRVGYKLFVVQEQEEIDDLMGGVLAVADEVLRYDRPREPFTLPHLSPLTCAAVCGNLVGIRASTVGGLRRRLLRNGAEIVIHGR